MDNNRITALTLVELLIAISVSAILTGVIMLMLQTSFDSFFLNQQEVLLGKAIDESIGEIANGGFEAYGIKDSLEILEITPTSITFIPLWVDASHTVKPEHKIPELLYRSPFILNRPFKPGDFVPIAEVSTTFGSRKKAGKWKQIPIKFVPGEDPAKPNDKVFLRFALGSGTRIKFLYKPDATHFPDCAMTIKYKDGKIIRTYKGRTDTIPKHDIPGVVLTDLKLRYFDNTNTEIRPKNELIPNVTAVKVELTASLKKGKSEQTARTMRGLAFVNLRNTRTGGKGLAIQKNTKIKIPNSRKIRLFGITNIMGFEENDIIELEAHPDRGKIWEITLQLGFDKITKVPIIKKYTIEYPPGAVVYSETINLETDSTLNFLTLGGGSRYDYDFDKEGGNVVNLEGDVELIVTEMDAKGAALFIRP